MRAGDIYERGADELHEGADVMTYGISRTGPQTHWNVIEVHGDPELRDYILDALQRRIAPNGSNLCAESFTLRDQLAASVPLPAQFYSAIQKLPYPDLEVLALFHGREPAEDFVPFPWDSAEEVDRELKALEYQSMVVGRMRYMHADGMLKVRGL